jgi:hypothetical protein
LDHHNSDEYHEWDSNQRGVRASGSIVVTQAESAGAGHGLGCARVVREQQPKTAPLAPLYQSERVK